MYFDNMKCASWAEMKFALIQAFLSINLHTVFRDVCSVCLVIFT